MAAVPQSITTLFVISVTIMVFFTTSASNQIEEIENPNVRFIGTGTLIMSYCLLLIFGVMLIAHNAVDDYPTLFAGLKVVYAAFIVPAFILMYDLAETLAETYHDPDFSILRTTLVVGSSCSCISVCFPSPRRQRSGDITIISSFPGTSVITHGVAHASHASRPRRPRPRPRPPTGRPHTP